MDAGYEDINWTGLDFERSKFDELQRFDGCSWQSEVIGHEELFIDLHKRAPHQQVAGGAHCQWNLGGYLPCWI
jgi:GTP-dependent phosphoenolpyruvate carboxykinase